MRGSADLTSELLDVVQVGAIESETEPRWLVEHLWAEEGVGIIGGAPKCCKTWLALELAHAVATGVPALGRYAVGAQGPVLVFAAEDSPRAVRRRLEGLAARRSSGDIERLPLYLIRSSRLRLDRAEDRERLTLTVTRYRPRLLVLDPFVRLHEIDENSALEVSRVLAYLRELQREEHVAVLVVHHARKAQTGVLQAGLSLRGSSDFHAWGDSNLYLRRAKERLEMVVEHRSASAPAPIALVLREERGTISLEALEPSSFAPNLDPLKKRILELVSQAEAPSTQESLRGELKVRLQSVVTALRDLEREGKLVRSSAGWELNRTDEDEPLDVPECFRYEDTG